VVISTVPIAESPGRYFPLSGPLLGGCSCRVSAFFLAARSFIQQPDDHWHLLYSNLDAVLKYAYFQLLAFREGLNPSEFW